ncbi:MAG: cytochrome B5 [Deltaproteobacteria bacterium]|nr:MAG: cytochrome B5 [Deltaproteobacteria bacterium]
MVERGGRFCERLVILLAFVLMALLIVNASWATEEFALESNEPCKTCHLDETGGGTLTPVGEAFLSSGYKWPPPQSSIGAPKTFGERIFKMLLGMAHLIAAFAWIGTILYVHLVLKPKYAKGGLPKTEMRIAFISIIILGVTGVILTKMRYHHPAALLDSTSGKLLLVKIGLYLFLVLSALYVSQVLSPKLKKLRAGWQSNDGVDGRPAWVKVEEALYDLSTSERWKDGNHFGRHQAGEDMTEALKGAPHGVEKLEGFPTFSMANGDLNRESKEVRLLYMMAYVNLGVAFGILLVVGMWRFW